MKKIRCLLCLVLMLVLTALCLCALPLRAAAEETESSAASSASSASDSPLYGKSVLFVGDSICSANCEMDDPKHQEHRGWSGRIELSDGIIRTDNSRSGASVSNCRLGNIILMQLQKESGKQFDLIVLHGGVNDAWDGIAVGEISETGKYDSSTFAGGLETLFSYAKEAFPDAKLCYLINYRLPAADRGAKLKDMSEYFNMAKSICDKWEIPYLDMYDDEEINRALDVAGGTTYLYDHIHPSSAGYDVLAPYIAAFLRSLYEPEEPVVSEDEEESKTAGTPSETLSAPGPHTEEKNDFVKILLITIGGIVILGTIVLLAMRLGGKSKENS